MCTIYSTKYELKLCNSASAALVAIPHPAATHQEQARRTSSSKKNDMPLNERVTATAHIMDTWIPRISALWSATTDDKCPHAPTSDDYNMWSHVQLKRELVQRKIRIDPKSRNKQAYAALLLASDAATESAAASVHDDTASTEPATCEIESIDIQSVDASQPAALSCQATSSVRSSQEPVSFPITRPPRVVLAPTSSVQEPSPRSDAASATTKTLAQVPHTIAIIEDDDIDPAREIAAKDNVQCTTLQKRKRDTQPSEHAIDLEANKTQQHEYMRRALALKAAKVDLQTRRLEMDTKRDEHSQELQQVQLALAQEQLKQAKLSTQKLSTEWVVEQALHKKRLRDAGFSEHDIAAIV